MAHRLRAPHAAVCALAAALGVQGAVILIQIVGADARVPPPGKSVMANPARTSIDPTSLASGHLFGLAPPPAPVDDANAPQASVPLILTGICAATNPKDGLAIIGTSASSTKVYAVGEWVPGNARVQAVYVDRVLLDRNGVVQALVLARKSGIGRALRAGPDPSSVEQMRAAIARQSMSASGALRPQPVFVEGKLRGYRVFPGSNSMMGLRKGDLVVAINGAVLDDPAQGNDMFNRLGNADTARLTVMRGGRPHEITVDMSRIAN